MVKSIFYIFIFCSLFSTVRAQDSWNVFLLDNWNPDTLLVSSNHMVYTDCWGFVQDGQEYAVIGSTEGTHFFKIGNDNKLHDVGFVRGRFSSAQVVHRDYKDYHGYLYAVCDEGPSSLQIIDLHYLPDSIHVAVDNDTIMGRVHNIFIDTSSALLYACSFTAVVNNPSTLLTPMKVFSIANPIDPVEVYSGPNDINLVHDAYVINDTAFLNCGFDGLRIYDFSNPTNPVWIGALTTYQDQGFNHSGWMSPDRKFYYFGDETSGKRIKKVNIADLANPEITAIFGTDYQDLSIPHNMMVDNKLIFVAYYNEGFRVYDTRYQPPKEIAHYDTYPDVDPYKMDGAWGVYAKLPSGRILISDRKYGLFLFEFDAVVFNTVAPKENFTFYPNPAHQGEDVVFRFNESKISTIEFEIYDKAGRIVYSNEYQNQDYWTFTNNLSAGTYAFSIKYKNYLKEDSYHYGQLVVIGKQ